MLTAHVETVSDSSACRPHLDLVRAAQPLAAADCDRIAGLCRTYPEVATTVVDQDRLSDHRVCRTHMIPRGPSTEPIYDLLWAAAEDAASRHYGLKVSGINRLPHYVEYHEGRGHFHWHNDYSHESDEAPRKLTVVIQLSDPQDYRGGVFEVFGSSISEGPRDLGAVFCLPSIIPHRVTPVTQGVRRAIVAWVAGPRFR
jgi:predicted 2-oxoglutarate/Fe(II)-dependent dioxygenase YbiX